MAIERISGQIPAKDPKGVTSQSWNTFASQVNQRIIENVGGQGIEGAFNRVRDLFGSIHSRLFDLVANPNIAHPVGTLIRDIRNRPTDRTAIRIGFLAAKPLFEGYAEIPDDLTRGWASSVNTPNYTIPPPPPPIQNPVPFFQTYLKHLNDDGSKYVFPRAKYVAEVLSAFVSEFGRGNPDVIKSNTYSIRDVAPDYERFFAEPQFRFAEQLKTVTIDDDKTTIGIGTELTDEESADGKTYRFFELIGTGTYRLSRTDDEGEQIEEEVNVDGYLWLPDGWSRVERISDEGTAEATIMVKRAPTYADALLYAFIYLVNFTPIDTEKGTGAENQQSIFDSYFKDSTLSLEGIMGEMPRQEWQKLGYGRRGAIQNDLAAFGEWWCLRNYGSIFIVPNTTPVDQTNQNPRVNTSIGVYDDVQKGIVVVSESYFEIDLQYGFRGLEGWEATAKKYKPADDATGLMADAEDKPFFKMPDTITLGSSFSWVKILPYAKEDDNVTQEKSDTRCYAYYFTQAYTLLRCIATAFSDTIIGHGNVTIVRDLNVERFATALGLENFIVAANNRDHFSALPNTDYAVGVMSKLNDAVNLLRAIRVSPRYKIRFQQTSYRYVSNEMACEPSDPAFIARYARNLARNLTLPDGWELYAIPPGGWSYLRADEDEYPNPEIWPVKSWYWAYGANYQPPAIDEYTSNINDPIEITRNAGKSVVFSRHIPTAGGLTNLLRKTGTKFVKYYEWYAPSPFGGESLWYAYYSVSLFKHQSEFSDVEISVSLDESLIDGLALSDALKAKFKMRLGTAQATFSISSVLGERFDPSAWDPQSPDSDDVWKEYPLGNRSISHGSSGGFRMSEVFHAANPMVFGAWYPFLRLGIREVYRESLAGQPTPPVEYTQGLSSNAAENGNSSWGRSGSLSVDGDSQLALTLFD